MKSRATRENLHAKTAGLLLACLICVFSDPAWSYYTQNGRIYDDNDVEIQLHGVAWFGFETGDHVVHGLWARNWQKMILQVKQHFNAVRVPFCPDTLKNVKPSSIDFSRNPDLKGLKSLQILDKVLTELDQQGLYILLDHHRSECNGNPPISELWYTANYTEQEWIADLVFLADRYKHLPHFVGIDIKNEPHGAATWGTGVAATDWKLAAEAAAAAVLAANSNLLIFVEGIEQNPICSGNISHWWGGNFEPMACFPPAIQADKLVLSPHVYGPDVFPESYFFDPNFPQNMSDIWDAHFGFLTSLVPKYTVVVGEFGGRYGHGGLPEDRAWQDAFVAYLYQKGLTNFFYWDWNPNSGDTGGILKGDWRTVWKDKISLLCRLRGCLSQAAEKLPNGQVGAAYSTPLVTGGAAPYTWIFIKGKFPPGLNFDSATGNLIGTPVSPALLGRSFTVNIKDQLNASVKRRFTIKIDP
ncbi:MAG TPA: cellulase family glycosylhydrolase [Candidatus Binatia bacterium]|jgi:endoglucanase